MNNEEIKAPEEFRTGKVKAYYQHLTDPKKNKQLVYNGYKTIDGKVVIILVEK